MDTPDPNHGPVPARQAHVPPTVQVTPAEFDDDYYNDSSSSKKKLSPGLVWRAFRRYWWQALLLWAIGSAGLVALAYYRVKPTYEAVAQVSVEPPEEIFERKSSSLVSFTEYRNSQVSLITGPVVLSLALSKYPELYTYPKLKDSLDAEAEIRHVLQVAPVRETNQIQVSMTSELPAEAAAVVNAVVNAYIENAQEVHEKDAKRRRENLLSVLEEARNAVSNKRSALQKLGEEHGEAVVKQYTDQNRLSVNDYAELNRRLTAVSVERVKVQSYLEMLRGEKTGLAAGVSAPDELAQKDAISNMFYSHPSVVPIVERHATLKSQHDSAVRKIRSPSDPALSHYRQQMKALEARLDNLWHSLEPTIRGRVLNGAGDDGADNSVRGVERQLASLVAEEQALKARLSEMTVQNDRAANDGLKLEFARNDLTTAEAVQTQLERHFKQLEFDSKGTFSRIRLDFQAKPMLRPSTNHRVQAMAAAPVGMLFAVLGLLTLFELHSGRVADPDELSSRVRLQVLGVVPPLPRLRPAGGQLMARNDYRAQRQLDEFVQSLDHLRVALCARPDPWGRNRHCVLITSAIGSEGKTTLAAQLAERCVNAGLMTLLIDADLRNPTLSRMLDASGQRGLVNVLRGEQAPEDVMLIVEDAGGFHFLPAGTPRMDPSRLLQGDQLGNLLAQARESFDIVIVDAPPVLPVPDALTIGRWTDGAVLAVRYDTSRFPLVERANRRLATVGVPVLGAVVNGVRPSQGGYGGYYAYGGSSTSAEPAV